MDCLSRVALVLPPEVRTVAVPAAAAASQARQVPLAMPAGSVPCIPNMLDLSTKRL